jgi:hypothetical protein
MTSLTYQPSGRIPRIGLCALLATALATTFLAQGYAWLMISAIPHSKSEVSLLFRLLALLGMGTALAVLARRVAAWGKIRHPAWMGWAGAAIGLLAWYVQWAACVVLGGMRDGDIGLDFSAMEFVAGLCFRPEALFVWGFEIPLINASVTMRAALIACWLIEFCAFLFPPMLAGRKRAAMPFCEKSDKWATEIDVTTDFEWLDDPQAARHLLEADPTRFASLLVPCVIEPVGNHARVTVYRCPGSDSFITIRNCREMPEEAAPLPHEVKSLIGASAGKVECFWEEPVVELLRVPIPDPDALLRHWSDAANDRGGCARPGARVEPPRGSILSKS